MGIAEQRRRAVAISAADLPESGQLLVNGCEDCSTAASPAALGRRAWSAPGQAPLAGALVRAAEARELAVDDEHWLAFNPAGDGGAVVLNEAARQVLRCFHTPLTVAAARTLMAPFGDDVTVVAARLSEAGVIHPVGEPARPAFGESATLTAWLHVSNACNLRCPYCYVHKSTAGMDSRVGRASVDALIDSALTHGFSTVKLKYAGGEASLNKKLVLELDAYARERAAAHGLELQAVLLSNGVALRPAFVEALKAAGVRIMISLDGVGAAHDAQRPFVNGRPSFRYVEATIHQLLDQGHPPHLSITITSRNASGVADAVRFALDRGLTFSLNFFRDNECAADVTDLRFTETELIEGLLAAFAVIRERPPSWSVLGSILDRGQLLQPRQRPCGVGQDYVVIDHEGKVAKCHMEVERTLGDVFRDDPLQLVRRDTATTLNLLVDEKEGCRDCSWRYWCSGGCPVATFAATGRYDVKSPNCGIYKAIYPEALRLEGLRLLKYAGNAVV
jgi:uncharacterized protein